MDHEKQNGPAQEGEFVGWAKETMHTRLGSVKRAFHLAPVGPKACALALVVSQFVLILKVPLLILLASDHRVDHGAIDVLFNRLYLCPVYFAIALGILSRKNWSWYAGVFFLLLPFMPFADLYDYYWRPTVTVFGTNYASLCWVLNIIAYPFLLFSWLYLVTNRFLFVDESTAND